jgi:translation initiation factor 2 subunit 2
MAKIKKANAAEKKNEKVKEIEEARSKNEMEKNEIDIYDYEKLLEKAYRELPKQKSGNVERFQVPEIKVEVEGNKTLFRNFQAIVEKIRREKKHFMDYLKKELGAPVKQEGEMLVIQKKVKPEFLKRKIEIYIDDYVLCHECKRPDTNITTINNIKFLICEACGARRVVRK